MVGGNNNQLKLVDNSGLDGVLGRAWPQSMCRYKSDIWAGIVIVIIGIWLLIAGKAIWCIFWVREA
jgi:hypothetical protein